MEKNTAETFYNRQSGETLKYSERADGKRDLYVWQGDTTDRNVDHQHAVLYPNGSPAHIRDFDGYIVADDDK